MVTLYLYDRLFVLAPVVALPVEPLESRRVREQRLDVLQRCLTSMKLLLVLYYTVIIGFVTLWYCDKSLIVTVFEFYYSTTHILLLQMLRVEIL